MYECYVAEEELTQTELTRIVEIKDKSIKIETFKEKSNQKSNHRIPKTLRGSEQVLYLRESNFTIDNVRRYQILSFQISQSYKEITLNLEDN